MDRADERPALRTRLTGGLNAVIWALPLPTRVVRLASEVVYRNPPISEERLIETVEALDRAGVDTVLAGGWGVDALHGKQLRSHHDIDLLIESTDLPRARRALAELGYEPWHSDPSATTLGHLPISSTEALRDGTARVVELHGACLSSLELTTARIGDGRVRCMAADLQLRIQQLRNGKEWTRHQRRRRQKNLEAIESMVGESSASSSRVVQQDSAG
jgi:lincosamide nucleotidyltransferase A/C/D/E